MEFIAVVKRECETCQLVEPLLAVLQRRLGLTVYCQDDPRFPESLGGGRDDRELGVSWRHRVEVVPTLLKLEAGRELDRAEGWHRQDWQRVSGLAALGEALPASQPGCGSRSCEPGMAERLGVLHGDIQFGARRLTPASGQDVIEYSYGQGWSDGLPVVPPTTVRVAAMLAGTTRRADEVIGRIPPNLVSCTVEKVAINAVMAGCRPEYFPVVLASVEAALQPAFSMHGLLATLWFSGPVMIVNGPVARRIGMNAGGNALGQGNRANATIGRALQLLVRNVGGGVPGGIDRAVLGNPGKYTFCFAEDESDPDWVPLHVARGVAPGRSAITLFHGDGVQGVNCRAARSAEELARSLAMGLAAVGHPKICQWSNAILVLSPDHHALFKAAGWGRAEVETALAEALRRPGRELVAGYGGVAEGIDATLAEQQVDKFRPGGLLVVRAGGRGGAMSAVIGGWTGQRRHTEVQTVTQEIGT